MYWLTVAVLLILYSLLFWGVFQCAYVAIGWIDKRVANRTGNSKASGPTRMLP